MKPRSDLAERSTFNMHHSISRRLLCYGALLLAIRFACDLRAGDIKEIDSFVVQIQGKARLRREGQMWVEVTDKMPVRSGCEIQTAGSGSYVDIVFGTRFLPMSGDGIGDYLVQWGEPRIGIDGMRIFENSILEMDSVRGKSRWLSGTRADKVRLSVSAGRVICSTRTSKPHPDYEVCLTNAVVRATNAVFFVEASGLVGELFGTVHVSMPARRLTREVKTGEVFNCVTGELDPTGPGWPRFPLRNRFPTRPDWKPPQRPF